MNLKRIVKTPWLNSALAILLGLYYGTLDIWGDEWSIIKDYLPLHSAFYIILMLLTLISIVVKCFIEVRDEKEKEKLENIKLAREELLKDFLYLIKNIVSQKKNRFYDRVIKISNDRQRINFFDEITHPKDQIRQIMTQVEIFLKKYGVPANHIEMTVIGSNTKDPNWEYLVKSDRQRKYTNANIIMNGNSLARKVMEGGQSLFVSDLKAGIGQNAFLKSERSDNVDNTGSIYCKPVTLKIQQNTYKYVFTLVSYGTYLCSPSDQQEANEFLTLLDEIGDRVELELYLLAMKQHKE